MSPNTLKNNNLIMIYNYSLSSERERGGFFGIIFRYFNDFLKGTKLTRRGIWNVTVCGTPILTKLCGLFFDAKS